MASLTSSDRIIYRLVLTGGQWPLLKITLQLLTDFLLQVLVLERQLGKLVYQRFLKTLVGKCTVSLKQQPPFSAVEFVFPR